MQIEKPYLVGISGGSGSGKSYWIKKLLDGVGSNAISHLAMDNYYKPSHLQPHDENNIANFDLPESLYLDQFHADLVKLINGETISRTEYTYNNTLLIPGMIETKPAKVILIDGIFIYHVQAIQSLLDLKIYIDVPDFLMLKRRIIRDAEMRGYDLTDVLYRFEHHVIPAYRRFVEPYSREVDFIIPNHESRLIAFEIILQHLKNRV